MKTIAAILLVAGFAVTMIGSAFKLDLTGLAVAGWGAAITYYIAYESEKSK